MFVNVVLVFFIVSSMSGYFSIASDTMSEKMQAVDRLWKARGLQAIEQIDTLIKKNGTSKGRNL